MINKNSNHLDTYLNHEKKKTTTKNERKHTQKKKRFKKKKTQEKNIQMGRVIQTNLTPSSLPHPNHCCQIDTTVHRVHAQDKICVISEILYRQYPLIHWSTLWHCSKYSQYELDRTRKMLLFLCCWHESV